MEPTVRNPARERLEAGELALGVGIRQSRTVDIAAIMKACGYDWLFLDLEHNSMDLDTAVQISVAALGAGIAPIVRVPAGQFWLATRVLDGGALGIVMPHVDTPEEAREIADRLRYPPQGHRSIAGGLPHFGYVPIAASAACAAINAATLVVVMLETPQAIANAPAIAAVPGINSLLIGTSDLSMELGIPGQFGDERIVEAYRTVVEACNAHGKFAGIGGVYEESLMRRYIGMGVRLVWRQRSRFYDRRRDRAGKAAARLPLNAISPDAGGRTACKFAPRFLFDKIHDLFYDARIFGSVDSLTSR